MNIYALTDEQLEILEIFAENRPEWMTENFPEFMEHFYEVSEELENLPNLLKTLKQRGT